MAKQDYLFQLGYSMTAEIPEPSDPFVKDADGLPYAAQHVIIDAYGCVESLDYTIIERLLIGLDSSAKPTLNNRILMAQCQNGSYQLSLTAWPERNYVSLDYMSFDSFDLPALILVVKSVLTSVDVRVMNLFRGDRQDHHNATMKSC